MPEQISKYPQVTLKILKEAGAVCGEGAPQKILTACPPERFCSLPSGEICVYGLADLRLMTQITEQELASVVCPGGKKGPTETGGWPPLLGVALGGAFLVGLWLGRFWRAKSGGRNRPHVEN